MANQNQLKDILRGTWVTFFVLFLLLLATPEIGLTTETDSNWKDRHVLIRPLLEVQPEMYLFMVDRILMTPSISPAHGQLSPDRIVIFRHLLEAQAVDSESLATVIIQALNKKDIRNVGTAFIGIVLNRWRNAKSIELFEASLEFLGKHRNLNFVRNEIGPLLDYRERYNARQAQLCGRVLQLTSSL